MGNLCVSVLCVCLVLCIPCSIGYFMEYNLCSMLLFTKLAVVQLSRILFSFAGDKISVLSVICKMLKSVLS